MTIKMADTDPFETTSRPQKIKSRKKYDANWQRLCGRKTGPDCICSRSKCFQVIEEAQRTSFSSLFNELPSEGEQDAFLASCIAIKSSQPRRSLEEYQSPMPNESTYDYSVYVSRNVTYMKVHTA